MRIEWNDGFEQAYFEDEDGGVRISNWGDTHTFVRDADLEAVVGWLSARLEALRAVGRNESRRSLLAEEAEGFRLTQANHESADSYAGREDHESGEGEMQR